MEFGHGIGIIEKHCIGQGSRWSYATILKSILQNKKIKNILFDVLHKHRIGCREVLRKVLKC